MASLSAIRDGLVARLATISGLRVYKYMPARVEPPAVAIKAARLEPDQDFAGTRRFVFDLWLYVSGTEVERGQAALDVYTETAIPVALDADTDLAGAADYAHYLGYTQGPELVDSAGVQLLAQPCQVEVVG